MSTLTNQTQQTPTVAPEITDEELMQGVIERQQSSLDLLYARYRPLIGRIVTEILPNDADAEEALQDVFLEIWNRAANFDVRKGKPLGWIICMARRRAIDHYRKIRRRAEANEKLRAESERTHGEGSAGLAAISVSDAQPAVTDLRKFLTGMIGSLPVEQGRVIQMSYFNEMSQREIASHTGIPLGTVKTRLDLALRKLLQKSMQYREELYYAY